MAAAFSIGLVVAALLGTLFLISFLGSRYSWPSEWQRKLLHVALGLTAISFHWVFDRVWQVAVVSVPAVAVMLLIRRLPVLRHSVGAGIYSVDRSSIGELLYAVVIVLLYALADGNAMLYVIPIAILALSDAAAALVGTHFGMFHFAVADGRKSWEGVFTFATVTACLLFLLLLVLSDLSLLSILLIALIFSTLGALIEAISWRGWDNFFVPLAAHLFLASLLDHDTWWLFFQLLILAGVVFLGLRAASASQLNTHALMTVVVAAYCFGVVGGFMWVLVPVLVFLCHLVLSILHNEKNQYTVAAAMSLSSSGFFWLVIHKILAWPEIFLCYSHAFAIHLQIITLLRLKGYRRREAEPVIVLLAGLLSGGLVLSLSLISLGNTPLVLSMYATALAVMFLGGLKTGITVDRFSRARWIAEGRLALLGSLCPFLTLYIGRAVL